MDGSWGPKQIARSVKFSDAWVPGVVADLAIVKDRKEKQREHVENTSKTPTRTGRPWTTRSCAKLSSPKPKKKF